MELQGKRTQETAARIVQTFRRPEELPNMLAAIFIHRKDDVPCRRWSWHNQLLCEMAGTRDARSYEQWHAIERFVKRGSKAFWILAPWVTALDENMDEGAKPERGIVHGFRSVPVFRVEDTDGPPLNTESQCDRPMGSLALRSVAESWGIDVETHFYASSHPLEFFGTGAMGSAVMSGADNLSAWIQELVQAAGHRLFPQSDSGWDKDIVAELGSAVLLEYIGQNREADLRNPYEYIRRHASQNQVPMVKGCIRILDRVCGCVKLILDTAEQSCPFSTHRWPRVYWRLPEHRNGTHNSPSSLDSSPAV